MNPIVLAALFQAAGSGIAALGTHPAQQQFRQSYSGSEATNPIELLSQTMTGIGNLQHAIGQLPISTRSSYVQPGPSPISIPGVPFQIGAGRAVDPALSNPNLLSLDTSPLLEAFQNLYKAHATPTEPAPNPRKVGY